LKGELNEAKERQGKQAVSHSFKTVIKGHNARFVFLQKTASFHEVSRNSFASYHVEVGVAKGGPIKSA
jgi:hypothetical protein